MAEYVISSANLSEIESRLKNISKNIEVLNGNIGIVNENIMASDKRVDRLSDALKQLASDFNAYVDISEKRRNLSCAEEALKKILEQLETEYAQYIKIRKLIKDILSSQDIGLAAKSVYISDVQELMAKASDYWMVYCLAAMVSEADGDEKWMTNIDLARQISPEKTALFFAIVGLRKEYLQNPMEWLAEYFKVQDPKALDPLCISVIDGYSRGAFGEDVEQIAYARLKEWTCKINGDKESYGQQLALWTDVMNWFAKTSSAVQFDNIQKYTDGYSFYQDYTVSSGVHSVFLEHLEYGKDLAAEEDPLDNSNIISTVLEKLISDHGEEEKPIREREKYNKSIITFNGDVQSATNARAQEKAQQAKVDFSIILAEAAVPEGYPGKSAFLYTGKIPGDNQKWRKIAFDLSFDWKLQAYRSVCDKIDDKIPGDIEFNIDGYISYTLDGEDEADHAEGIKKYTDGLLAKELKMVKLGAGKIVSLVLSILALGVGAGAPGYLFLYESYKLSLITAIITSVGVIFGILGIFGIVKFITACVKNSRKKADLNAAFSKRTEEDLEKLKAFSDDIISYRKENKKRNNVKEEVEKWVASYRTACEEEVNTSTSSEEDVPETEKEE